MEVIEEQRGDRETARKYAVNHCMIQRWIKVYFDKGSDGLIDSLAIRHQEGDDVKAGLFLTLYGQNPSAQAFTITVPFKAAA